MEFEKLDSIDRTILEHLTENGRISYAELGRIVDLTRAAVRDRINSLVEQGIIDKFTIIVNPRKAGKTLSLFFDIEVEWNKLLSVADKVTQIENITNVYQMSGKPSLHVHALVDDQEQIEALLRDLRVIDGITSIKSDILLTRFKERGSFLV
ncbi:Lrp/AsnC family transcriptional regulator [Paenibacillus beijingensis]|uniref:AsnC family transcriptional regulator n=1 Tax=Paenibacillus beijingensis TaxID=1126833 RepID=A0A0D5NJU6_9BACL|nr:Lrp/AsnC family transcriptional regulator [Paenibacillus beijingensis]AJY75193.1 AsnC family transcriptional regulator [Paenibacillus beijingensis]